MDALPEHSILKKRPGTLEAVRRDVNLDKPGEMKAAVRMLDEWAKQQAHFRKKDFPSVYLETTILAAKGSLERAKRMLEGLCTVKTNSPRHFMVHDMKADWERVKGRSYILPGPDMTEEYYRIVVFKFSGKYGNPEIMEILYRGVYAAMEYLKVNDYNSGVILIFDLVGTDLLDAITNVNLLELKNCFMVLLESYGVRLKKIHLISASKLVSTFVNFFKQVLKKKIMDRILMHKSFEELHQYIKKDVLPKDYGGTGKSLDVLQDEFLDEISKDEFTQHRKNMFETQIDEYLRPPSESKDLNAGVYGTFRTLSID